MTYNESNGKWEGSAVLYPSSDAELVYGTTYTVSSFRKGTDLTELLRDTQTAITIDAEPARLVSTSTVDGENGTTLTLTSLSLPTGSEYSILVIGTPTVRSGSNEEDSTTLKITPSSATSNTLPVSLYPVSELKYGYTYSVKEMKLTGGSSSVLIEKSTCVFSTPTEPTRLVEFTKGLYDDEMKRIGFVMTGRVLDEEATYKVVLSASATENHTIDMTYNESNGKWEGSAVLYPSSDAELVYGTTYTVSSFRKGTDLTELLRDTQTAITIDAEPARLVSTSTVDGENGTTLTLTSLSLPTGSEYSIAVVGTPTVPSGSNEEDSTTLKITPSSATSNTLPVSLYPVSELELTGGSSSVLIEKSTCVFSTPTEPTRLVEFTKGLYDDEMKRIGFVMTGRVLDEEATYKVVLSASATENHTIDMTYNESNGKWEGSAVLYPSSDAELVYGTTYTVSSFRKGTDLTELLRDTQTAITIDAEPARLVSTSTVDGENGTTLTLTSLSLPTGSEYSILVIGTPTVRSGSNEEDSTTLKITPSSATSNTLPVSLYPVSELKYGYTYSVKEMKLTGGSSSVLIEKSTCVFSTPTEPTRLVEFTKGLYDDEMKRIGFVMTGRVLDEEATYKVVLSASATENHTIDMTYNESNGKWEGSAVLYPSSDAELVYGTTYTVSSFRKGTDLTELLRDTQTAITIDAEPARLVSTSTVDGENGTTLTLSSRVLSAGSQYLVKVVGTPTVPSGSNEEDSTTLKITPSSATSNTLPVSLYPVSELKYGYTYSVKEMKLTGGSSSVLIEKSTCVFSTPTEPTRLVEFTKGLYDDEMKRIGFVMTGRVLDEEATYKVVLSASATENHTIDMTYNESNGKWEGSAVLYPSSDAELVYGTTYTVSSFRKGTDLTELLRDTQTAITIDAEPARLVSTSTVDGENGTTLTLTSLSLPTGSEYSIAVVGTPTVPSGSNEEDSTTLKITPSSATSNTLPVSLYPVSELKYGYTYSVKEMKLTGGSSSVLIEKSTCVFSTPTEPTRLVEFTKGLYDDEMKRIGFVMTGRVLDEEATYKVVLSASATENHTIDMTYNESNGKWEGSAVLYPSSDAELVYGTTYTVSSFRKGTDLTELLRDTQTAITIDAEPARLVSTSTVDGENGTTLTLSSRVLSAGSQYLVKVVGTPTLSSGSNSEHTTTLTVTATTEIETKHTVSFYPFPGDLLYGYTYSVKEMKRANDSSPVLIEKSTNAFSTPTEPERLVSVSRTSFVSDSLQSTLSLSFASRTLLPNTQFTITFQSTAVPSIPSHTKTLTVTTENDGTIASFDRD
ncbi:hypothetical protein BLNAU_14132 [Blattamonas nauphoetae]|uniref:Uncharacterized protein n=1 Tax=Blattamonas nauphoetae TaxID=2049346 RepID=A0ABQ9XHW9_9EUKA|nr:hypothetical protein BLNAU_14132 [Blattamonas nauphoetae]